ncbi:MAG: hypothetical protein QXU64_02095 [Thermofilaceae archaeon]
MPWLADLIHYAAVGGFEEQYLSLFREILKHIRSTQRSTFIRSFAMSLDDRLGKMMDGMEGIYVVDLARRAHEIKMELLGHYVTPPKEIQERARSLVDTVFKR